MTQDARLPSPPPEKAQPPQYQDEKAAYTNPPEKGSICPKHNPTPTPHLDAQLHTPGAKAAAHTLTTAIDNATSGAHCTRCTANDAARTLTRYIFELRQSKKTGGWSKEEKRVAKSELKWLMREVKGVVREEKAKLKREGIRG